MNPLTIPVGLIKTRFRKCRIFLLNKNAVDEDCFSAIIELENTPGPNDKNTSLNMLVENAESNVSTPTATPTPAISNVSTPTKRIETTSSSFPIPQYE